MTDVLATKSLAKRSYTATIIRWLALLLMCSAYLQNGLGKAFDFSGAIAEMERFGLTPAVPWAVATIW